MGGVVRVGEFMESSESFGWKDGRQTTAHSYLWPAIKPFLEKGLAGNLIDAGCGNGWMAAEAATIGFNVVGIDASVDGVSVARATHPGLRFEQSSICDDMTQYFPDQADIILGIEVVEHLYAPQRFLARAFEALRPGGCIVLSAPYHGYLKNLAISILDLWDAHHDALRVGGHIKFLSTKTLEFLVEDAGFENVEFVNVGRVPLLWKSMVCSAIKPKL